MSGNVTNYADERARRDTSDLPELDEDLAAGVAEEMAAALAAASPLAAKPGVDANVWSEGQTAAAAPSSPLEVQWARFRDQFEDAMEGGLHRIEDLERKIAEGKAYFWPGANAAVVAERVFYPSGEAVLQTLWAVGDLEEVLTLEPGMAATARLLGCSRILVEGRKGWERLLKPAGYEPWSVTVSKVL